MDYVLGYAGVHHRAATRPVDELTGAGRQRVYVEHAGGAHSVQDPAPFLVTGLLVVYKPTMAAALSLNRVPLRM